MIYVDGADPERVAAHLLIGRAEGSGWTVEQLRAAASDACARAAPSSAVCYLERALEEPPPPELRADLLAELGIAEAVAGSPTAAEHLAAAGAALSDPLRRAELALARGNVLFGQGLHASAAQAYEQGLGELAEPPPEGPALELRDDLQTARAATAWIVSELQHTAAEPPARLLADALEPPRTHGQRLLLAQGAVNAAFAGQPAQIVLELAEGAWDDGRLLERDTADGIAWAMATAAVCVTGALERAIECAEAALQDARRRGSPTAFATASNIRALPALWQGMVTSALADLEQALDALAMAGAGSRGPPRPTSACARSRPAGSKTPRPR